MPKRCLHLHKLDHSGLDLLEELERCIGGPAETLVDQARQVGDLHAALDIYLANAIEMLLRNLKVLEENDKSVVVDLGEELWRYQ